MSDHPSPGRGLSAISTSCPWPCPDSAAITHLPFVIEPAPRGRFRAARLPLYLALHSHSALLLRLRPQGRFPEHVLVPGTHLLGDDLRSRVAEHARFFYRSNTV